jgi:hypothetical protein
MGEGRGIYRVLVGRPEGKRPLGRPRRRWEDNIKLDLREKGIDVSNWIRLAQDKVQRRALVHTIMNVLVPYLNNILHYEVSVYINIYIHTHTYTHEYSGDFFYRVLDSESFCIGI